jgi:hypothetical protein
MDFDTGHCRGDVATQQEEWIVNAKNSLEKWQEFYA